MLLEYLVPSRTRRQVWRTLPPQGSALTVRELARRAGLPYSNVHREVMRMDELGLLRMERAGRALLCSWDAKNPATRQLTALLDPRTGGAPADDAVYGSLKSWGAGLARDVRGAGRLSLEETLAYGAELARRDPDVAQAWPVVLARNRARVDLDRLGVLVRRLGQKRALGFLAAVTGTLLKDRSLLDYAEKFRDSRVRRGQDFFQLTRGKRAQALTESKSPELAKSWFFRMNTSLDSFRRHFDKFVERT